MGDILNKICSCGKSDDTFDRKSQSIHKQPRSNITIINMSPKIEPSEPPGIDYPQHSIPMDENTIRILIDMDISQLSPQCSAIKPSPPDMNVNLNDNIKDNININKEGQRQSMKNEIINKTDQETYQETYHETDQETGPETDEIQIPNEEQMIVHKNPRLSQLCTITDLRELQMAIDTNYEVRSNTTSPKTKTNKPYRHGKGSPWDIDDMDKLSFEMNKQLESLMKNETVLTPYNSHTGTPLDSKGPASYSLPVIKRPSVKIIKETPETNLLRDGSEEKWTTPRIKDEAAAMKREMFHLASNNSMRSYDTNDSNDDDDGQ